MVIYVCMLHMVIYVIMIYKNSSINTIMIMYTMIFLQHRLEHVTRQIIFFLNLSNILIVNALIFTKFKITKPSVLKIDLQNVNLIIACIKKLKFLKIDLNKRLSKFYYCFYIPILTKFSMNSYVNENYKEIENHKVNPIIYITTFPIFVQISEVKLLQCCIF